jgi:hypothetical protein
VRILLKLSIDDMLGQNEGLTRKHLSRRGACPGGARSKAVRGPTRRYVIPDSEEPEYRKLPEETRLRLTVRCFMYYRAQSVDTLYTSVGSLVYAIVEAPKAVYAGLRSHF